MKFLKTRDLTERYGIHPTTLWRWQKTMGFPAHRYLGNRKVWIDSEVEAWESKWRDGPSELPGNVRRLRAIAGSGK